MHAYLLALEIEPVEVNRVYVALPLHCTVMPWFFADHSPADVVRAVTPFLYSQPPITMVGGPADNFGHDKDIPVNHIANQDEVRILHGALLEAIEKLGIRFNEAQWTNDGFTPHVTRQRSGRFEQGSQATAHKLYLAEALVPEELTQKNIVARISLSGI